jgi:hypothetical protein
MSWQRSSVLTCNPFSQKQTPATETKGKKSTVQPPQARTRHMAEEGDEEVNISDDDQ